MANKTISLFGIDFDVTYSATKFHPATFDDPAYGGETEIESIRIGGFEIDDGVLSEATEARLKEEVANGAESWAAEERACAAEDRAERMHEDRMLEAA